MYPRSTLASAFTEPPFTCYKLLSRIQEPFLFVKRQAVVKFHIATCRSELAYCSRQARELILVEVQHPQRSKLPDLRRHARQLIAAEVQTQQRRELPDLRRQARQLIVVEAQIPQRRELPDLRQHACAVVSQRQSADERAGGDRAADCR